MHKPSTVQKLLIYGLLAIVLVVFLTPIYLIAVSSVDLPRDFSSICD